MTVQNFMQISQIYSHFEAYQTGKIQDSQVPTNHVPALRACVNSRLSGSLVRTVLFWFLNSVVLFLSFITVFTLFTIHAFGNVSVEFKGIIPNVLKPAKQRWWMPTCNKFVFLFSYLFIYFICIYLFVSFSNLYKKSLWFFDKDSKSSSQTNQYKLNK